MILGTRMCLMIFEKFKESKEIKIHWGKVLKIQSVQQIFKIKLVSDRSSDLHFSPENCVFANWLKTNNFQVVNRSKFRLIGNPFCILLLHLHSLGG